MKENLWNIIKWCWRYTKEGYLLGLVFFPFSLALVRFRYKTEFHSSALCFFSLVYFAKTLFLLKKKSRILSAVPKLVISLNTFKNNLVS